MERGRGRVSNALNESLGVGPTMPCSTPRSSATRSSPSRRHRRGAPYSRSRRETRSVRDHAGVTRTAPHLGVSTSRRWRELDLPMLGWRDRSYSDMRSTFITLAIEDGADPAILRDRVTHTKPKRSACDGYDRGPRWIRTGAESATLQVLRRPLATISKKSKLWCDVEWRPVRRGSRRSRAEVRVEPRATGRVEPAHVEGRTPTVVSKRSRAERVSIGGCIPSVASLLRLR